MVDSEVRKAEVCIDFYTENSRGERVWMQNVPFPYIEDGRKVKSVRLLEKIRESSGIHYKGDQYTHVGMLLKSLSTDRGEAVDFDTLMSALAVLNNEHNYIELFDDDGARVDPYDMDAETVVYLMPIGRILGSINAPDPGDGGNYFPMEVYALKGLLPEYIRQYLESEVDVNIDYDGAGKRKVTVFPVGDGKPGSKIFAYNANGSKLVVSKDSVLINPYSNKKLMLRGEWVGKLRLMLEGKTRFTELGFLETTRFGREVTDILRSLDLEELFPMTVDIVADEMLKLDTAFDPLMKSPREFMKSGADAFGEFFMEQDRDISVARMRQLYTELRINDGDSAAEVLELIGRGENRDAVRKFAMQEAGMLGHSIVSYMDSPVKRFDECTDEELSEALGVRVNRVREALYKLREAGMATSRDEQDEKGWFTFYWSLRPASSMRHSLFSRLRRVLKDIENQLDAEEVTRHFSCRKVTSDDLTPESWLTFEDAKDIDFLAVCGEHAALNEVNSSAVINWLGHRKFWYDTLLGKTTVKPVTKPQEITA